MGLARHDALARCSERQCDDLVEQALDLREEAVDTRLPGRWNPATGAPRRAVIGAPGVPVAQGAFFSTEPNRTEPTLAHAAALSSALLLDILHLWILLWRN